VALVGYTNSGKTTMLNALSGAGRSTADRLFETLETTTRLVESSGSDGSESRPEFVVTDTVGFISKLPTQLVRSFESTLEEARHADLQVLCADASSPDLEGEIDAVNATLLKNWGGPRSRKSVNNDGSHSGPRILCLNKVDLISSSRLEELLVAYPDAVPVSAISGDLHQLLNAIHAAISRTRIRMEVLIPHSEYGAVSNLYGIADIHASRQTEDGVWLDVALPRSTAARYSRYQVA
jgi:GTP-binding protein HflX